MLFIGTNSKAAPHLKKTHEREAEGDKSRRQSDIEQKNREV